MVGYIIRRVLWIIPVLIVVAAVTFFLMYRAPGGPWSREKPIPPATEQRLNEKFGLDKPVWFNPDALSTAWEGGERNPFTLGRAYLDSQFFNYMFGVAQGDLGPSYQSKGTRDVQDILIEKFPASAKLGLVGIAFAVIIGIPLGIAGALRQNSVVDYVSLSISTLGMSIPTFVIGVLLIIVLSQVFGIPPIKRPEEWNGLSTAYLAPGIVLGLGTMAYVTRLTRSAMLEITRQDYVRTARAKGLSSRTVVTRHMMRNAMIPVITILGPAIAALVTGSFIIESIFNVPGMGREFVTSIDRRDYSMIMGTTLFYAFLVAIANLWVDITYGLLDPRIRSR